MKIYQCKYCKTFHKTKKLMENCKCIIEEDDKTGATYGVNKIKTKEENYGNPEFYKIIEELKEIHSMKSFDYGKEKDPLSNLRNSKEFGISNWIGAMIRANDKIARIKTFATKKELKNESVEDALKDLANYAILALVLYREEKNGNQTKS